MIFTIRNYWQWSNHSSIGDPVARWSPSSHCLVRSQESGILYVDQEINSSTGSLVVGTIRIYFTLPIVQESLTEEPTHFQDERLFLDGDQSNFQRVIDPDNVLDLQVAMADLDLHYWFIVLSWIRPVPPVALPLNAGESTMDQWKPRMAIISDRGKSFLAEGISEFERENSIRHLATTPYHPQTNGMPFDSNHAVTGFSPFYLLFGTHPRLPTTKPPRSSLMPLDEIERMEENSEFIARNLEEVGSTISSKCQDKGQAEACENETASTKTLGLLLQSWRYGEDETPRSTKLEFNWKGLTMLSMLGIQELTGL
ncbi:hypothetical protein BASA83_000583 [Batrachochytrium salamandrivorans]|nr:hypothetical protein BASA83_000583 [Batrachochytrium salamandrivorans]